MKFEITPEFLKWVIRAAVFAGVYEQFFTG